MIIFWIKEIKSMLNVLCNNIDQFALTALLYSRIETFLIAPDFWFETDKTPNTFMRCWIETFVTAPAFFFATDKTRITFVCFYQITFWTALTFVRWTCDQFVRCLTDWRINKNRQKKRCYQRTRNHLYVCILCYRETTLGEIKSFILVVSIIYTSYCVLNEYIYRTAKEIKKKKETIDA